MARPLAFLLGVTLLAGLAAAGPPAAARAGTPASGCPADGTRGASLPGADASLATDIVAVGGRAAWIVGTHAGKSTPRRPWIVRRVSGGWRETRAGASASDSGLMAVDARGRSNAWAVGFQAVGRFLRPLAQRWDGFSWRSVGVPALGRSQALVDVAIAPGGSAWTVGYRTTARGPVPVALEHRPSGWVRRDPWMPQGTFGALTAIDVAADGTPWAVGWQSQGHALRPILAQWSQGGWNRVATGLPGLDGLVLTDIVADRTAGVHVLGYRGEGAQRRAVLWIRGDGGWTEDGQLRAVKGAFVADGLDLDGAGRARIAGGWRGGRQAGFAGTIASRAEDGWRIARAPEGLRSPSHLRGIAWADGAAWAVGWVGGEGIAAAVCDLGAVPSAPTGGRRQRSALRREGLRADAPRSTRRRTPAAAPAGGIRFRDVAARVGLPGPTTSHGATALDIDGDGWQDLLISRHTQQGRVLRNRGGRFVAAAADPLGASDRHGCAAADVDRDGRDDAYCSVGSARGAKLKTNELWIGLASAGRDQSSVPWGVEDPLGRGRRAAFVDIDGDPYPDLVVTNDPLRVDGLPSLDRAFLDGGRGALVPAPQLGLDLPVGGSCVLGADLDHDGDQEVVICTEEAWAGGGPGVHVFRRGSNGFRDATRALGVRSRSDLDAATGDLDGDRREDLVQISRSQLTVSLQRGGAQTVVATLRLVAGTAVALGDADGDGDLDIYVVEGGGGNAADHLFLNGGSGRAWRQVAIPQAGWGSADDVVVLDHDRNGTDDFLVLNGAEGRGPIQLIAGFR